MLSGKLGAAGGSLVIVLVCAQAALAAKTTIVVPAPEKVTEETTMHQGAAPTRLFSVEKSVVLRPGENRVAASLQVGGLGIGAFAPSIVGGMNLRADMGLASGWETGLSVSGLGGGNLLGNISLRGKTHWTDVQIGATPVGVGVQGNIGALAAGGGIGSASIALGVPLTAVLSPTVDLTLQPGLAFGFAAGGLLPGGASPTVTAGGLTPALGIGLEMGLTRNLTALIDGNFGFTTGLGASGNLGLRYGVTQALAGDLFIGYQGSPMTALNAGTIGVGGYYAF